MEKKFYGLLHTGINYLCMVALISIVVIFYTPPTPIPSNGYIYLTLVGLLGILYCFLGSRKSLREPPLKSKPRIVRVAYFLRGSMINLSIVSIFVTLPFLSEELLGAMSGWVMWTGVSINFMACIVTFISWIKYRKEEEKVLHVVSRGERKWILGTVAFIFVGTPLLYRFGAKTSAPLYTESLLFAIVVGVTFCIALIGIYSITKIRNRKRLV